ncbi:MAG: hybrid sensor histidine kinase/response regulator [Symploca sp. SIO1C4]|uniref:histidine kinase n=1 Tax=Symploca sp. SIO1C4 TaxID=2607765 RepID=A0A6B3NGD4_9CYAN|nr:hybrid sensor histidine kinase/response regulator [Symploca sp. SIO1C4]
MNRNQADTSTGNILVVDDTPENLRLLSTMLTEHGYKVRKVISGKLALDAAQVNPPDLILLDIMMPQINGYEVCKQLKASEQTAKIPVIFLSALNEAIDKVKAFNVGGADYITKPFQIEEVVARVENQLLIRRLQKQQQEHNIKLQQEISDRQQAQVALQTLNQELEIRVQARTAQLTQANQQLLKLENQLRQALVQEQELNEFKSRIITTISHEYRTPLTTINSSAELLELYRHKWPQEKQLNHLQRIQRKVKHLTSLVNDVLFLDKFEYEKIQLNLTPLDLIKFSEELVEELKMTTAKGQIIEFSYQGDCFQGAWDEKILRQILSNLLSNAIKYSPEVSVIKFQISGQDGKVVWQIKDQGIGIPPEDQLRVFESFHRANNVGNIPGIGLGLSITKKCVDLYNGQITCESEVGVGTIFTVTIPADQSKLNTEDAPKSKQGFQLDPNKWCQDASKDTSAMNLAVF